MKVFNSGGGADSTSSFRYLRMSPTESQFVDPWKKVLDDVNDSACILSRPMLRAKAEEYAKAINTVAQKVLCRIFPDLEEWGYYRIGIQRHLIGKKSEKGPSIVKKEPRQIEKWKIPVYNAREVKGGISQKLENEFRDAQLHVGIGYNSVWDNEAVSLLPARGFEVVTASELSLQVEMGGKSPVKDVGIAYLQGRRGEMEDQHIASTLNINAATKVPFFAVFDGHSGSKCSEYLAEHAGSYFQKALQHLNPKESARTRQIFNLLKLAFVSLDNAFQQFRMKDDPYDQSGSTALAAIIFDGYLWVANVGDSRAILCEPDGHVIALSEDAKPGIDKYRQGIEKRGGYVGFDAGVLRNNSGLAMARAVGHNELMTPWVNPRAKVVRYPLKDIKPGSVLLMACDGLWDMVSSSQAAKTVAGMPSISCTDISAHMALKAYSLGSGDNITAMAVRLHP